MFADADQQQEEHGQACAYQQIVHRMDQHLFHDLEEKETAKGEKHEQNPVLNGPVREPVYVDGIAQAHADGIDSRRRIRDQLLLSG
jgi:hypothetical protein